MLRAIRGRLRLRERLTPAARLKHDAELRWWVEQFDPVIRAGGFNPGDVFAFIDEEPSPTYAGRRAQIARAEVNRVLQEAGIDDPGFFDGRVVLDIGPGALGFPDACPARVSFGIDPLAERFRQAGLLLDSPAIHLTGSAEHLPFVSDSIDVVLARNSLDHVDDPERVVREARRVLRPQGTLILNVDVGHTPTRTEPHRLELDAVRGWLAGMDVHTERELDRSHGGNGHAVVLVAAAPCG